MSSIKTRLNAIERELTQRGEKPQGPPLVVYRLDDGRCINRLPDFRYDERGLPTGRYAPAESDGLQFYSQEELDELAADGRLIYVIHFVNDWQEPGGEL